MRSADLHNEAKKLDQLFYTLMEDIQHSTSLWLEQDNAFSKRTYVRTVFTLVEGIIQLLKADCLIFNEVYGGNRLTPEEIVLLKEEQASLKDNGSIQTKALKIPMLSNFRFAVNMHSKVHDLDCYPTYSGYEWESFRKSIKIRDRITHPCSIDDLAISDDDLAMVEKGMRFFRSSTIPLLSRQPNK